MNWYGVHIDGALTSPYLHQLSVKVDGLQKVLPTQMMKGVTISK